MKIKDAYCVVECEESLFVVVVASYVLVERLLCSVPYTVPVQQVRMRSKPARQINEKSSVARALGSSGTCFM